MHRAYRGTMCSENWRCFRGSINYATIPGLDRGLSERERKMWPCTTRLYDRVRVYGCVYPVIEINRARSLRHTVPRSHWHRESLWSSIGCPCDFRLAADLRIAPRERRFASHSDSQRKMRTMRVFEIIRDVFKRALGVQWC